LKLLAWSGVPSSEWKGFVPDTLSTKGQLARALADSGNRREALGVLTSTIRSTSEKRFLENAAVWAFDWGAPAVALEAGKRWLEQERDAGRAGIQFARATLLVARAHLELGEPKPAYQVFEEALATIESEAEASAPANLELLAGMAYLYLKVDQPIMAQSLLLKATELAPHDATFWLALARAYRKAGSEELSIQSYREVLRLQQENPQAERELRRLLLRSRSLAAGS
jgi:tetratricopeptide (TPR) repeat protein